MTWGETATTQVKGNHATPKQSRCFALTSIELLDAPSLLPRNVIYWLTLPSHKFIALRLHEFSGLLSRSKYTCSTSSSDLIRQPSVVLIQVSWWITLLSHWCGLPCASFRILDASWVTLTIASSPLIVRLLIIEIDFATDTVRAISFLIASSICGRLNAAPFNNFTD